MKRKSYRKKQRGKGFGMDLAKAFLRSTISNAPAILSQAAKGNKKTSKVLKNKAVKNILKATSKMARQKTNKQRQKRKTRKALRQKGNGILGSLLSPIPFFGPIVKEIL